MSEGRNCAADLLVQVSSLPDGDAEELSEMVAQLREELLELSVDAAEPLREDAAPDSSKGALAAVGGWLVVTLGPEALRTVIHRVAAWATRTNSTVEISLGGDVLKVTGLDRDQQKLLIEEWLTRQGAAS